MWSKPMSVNTTNNIDHDEIAVKINQRSAADKNQILMFEFCVISRNFSCSCCTFSKICCDISDEKLFSFSVFHKFILLIVCVKSAILLMQITGETAVDIICGENVFLPLKGAV